MWRKSLLLLSLELLSYCLSRLRDRWSLRKQNSVKITTVASSDSTPKVESSVVGRGKPVEEKVSLSEVQDTLNKCRAYSKRDDPHYHPDEDGA